MKNDNEWVAIDDNGLIWAYCGPGQNNFLGMVFKTEHLTWKSETDLGASFSFSLKTAARKVMDEVE